MEPPESWGVKYKCQFNVLEAFHCEEALPPDLLHDHLEGVVPDVTEDLLSIIACMVNLLR